MAAAAPPPFRLVRQLSYQSGERSMECFCMEPLGVCRDDDVRLGCGDAVHYHCLVHHINSKMGDRATMDLRGICCPYGGACSSHHAEPTPGRCGYIM